MTKAELLAFLRTYRLAVVSSIAPDGSPQAAVVGYAVSDDLEVVFDTLTSTRKYRNLTADPRVALVIGWDDEATVQLEGSASVPEGPALERARECYFQAHPDGRERLAWRGIAHVVVRPHWIRFTDYRVTPTRLVELGAENLAS